MRKKYIAIIISIILIASIITFGQMFTIKNIKVVYENYTDIADEGTILRLAGIGGNTNIFSLREKEIRNAVSSYYSKAVKIDIERSFPNTVIIHVMERAPMFVINVLNETYNGFIVTDKDFQRSDIVEEDIEKHLILVKNFSVKNTFDTNECLILRKIASTLMDLGLNEVSINSFIDNIDFANEKIVINLRQNNAIWILDKNKDISIQIQQIYYNYLALTQIQREDAELAC